MQISSEDVTMYDLVLEDLSQDGAFYPWIRSQESGGIGPCVLNHTATVGADIVEWTLDASPHHVGYDGLTVVDLIVRNTSTCPLEKYTPKHGARLISTRQISKHFNSRNLHGSPGDRCIIRFAIPGYNSGKRAAIVFFWFEDGGANGGGTAIYWFEKFEDAWELRSKCVSYHGRRSD